MFRSIAVLQKKDYHLNMKQIVTLSLLSGLVFLTACSFFDDDLVVCPPLSAPVEGARAFVLTDEHQQVVDVRLNGVSAECTAESDGNVLMEIKAGMKITRNLSKSSEPDIAVVPIMTAVLDANDNVLSNETFGYKNGFDTDLERLLPVFEFDLVVPADGRAVISLRPTYK